MKTQTLLWRAKIITVNQPLSTAASTNTTNNQNTPSSNANNTTFNLRTGNIDTIGTFMVPTRDLDAYITELTDRGLVIKGMHDFKDLRGGQEGTGDTQTLLVWGADTSTMNSDQVISILKEITPQLPYS